MSAVLFAEREQNAREIAPGIDGGFLLAGTASTKGVFDTDALVVMTDADAKILWSATFAATTWPACAP